jgi:hypothetical protein
MVVGRAAFLRNSARHSHRLLSKFTANDNRLNYKNARFVYQEVLRSAKNKSFAEFQRVTTASDFLKLYLNSLTKRKLHLFLIRYSNGIPTSDPSRTINSCAEHFFLKYDRPIFTIYKLGAGCCRCCNLLFKY